MVNVRVLWLRFWYWINPRAAQRAIQRAIVELKALQPKRAELRKMIADNRGERHLDVVKDEK
jgi:hypothetical protein